jgi:hypothetical protein
MDRLFNPKCYKKPIPTDMINITQLDFLGRALIREIISMARTVPETEVFWHGNKMFSVDLDHGQMILRVSNIAESLGISSDKVKKRLEIINEIYIELEFQGEPFGTIITVKDYDSLIKMVDVSETKNKTKQYRNQNESSTSNKIDKTDKSDDIYKDYSDKKVKPTFSFE